VLYYHTERAMGVVRRSLLYSAAPAAVRTQPSAWPAVAAAAVPTARFAFPPTALTTT
jgi:hypothetical protein